MSEPPNGDGVRRPALFLTAVATYGTNLTVAVLSLVNVLIVARVLGPAGRGDVAFLIAIATLTATLTQLGVHDANANFAGTEPRRKRQLATNSLLLAALLGATGGGFVAALGWVAPSVFGELELRDVWIALVAIPFVMARLFLTFLVQAGYTFAVTNLAWLSGPLTALSANAVLAATGHLTVTSAIGAWVGGQVLGVCILIWHVARATGFGAPSLILARRTLGFGAKTHVGRSFAIGGARADQWIVGALAGSKELGLYSVAVAWAEALHYLPGVLVMVQRPDLVRASRERAAEIASKIFRVAVVLGVLASIVLILAAPVLTVYVFGEDFRGSIDDLRILALGSVGIAALALLGNALVAQRRPILASAAEAVSFVAIVALDFLLVPRWGGAGAALAATLAFTVGGVVVAIVYSRAFRAPIRDLVPRGDELPWLWTKTRRLLAGLTGRPGG